MSLKYRYKAVKYRQLLYDVFVFLKRKWKFYTFVISENLRIASVESLVWRAIAIVYEVLLCRKRLLQP